MDLTGNSFKPPLKVNTVSEQMPPKTKGNTTSGQESATSNSDSQAGTVPKQISKETKDDTTIEKESVTSNLGSQAGTVPEQISKETKGDTTPENESVTSNSDSRSTPLKSIALVNSGESGIFPKLGLFAGVVSIIFSFIVLAFDGGGHCSYSTYGADFYTDVQHGVANAANNLADLISVVKFGLFAVLFVLGIALICHFGAQLKRNK